MGQGEGVAEGQGVSEGVGQSESQSQGVGQSVSQSQVGRSTLTPSHPHTPTPSHPHTLTPSRSHALSCPLALMPSHTLSRPLTPSHALSHLNAYSDGIGFRFKPSQGVVGQWDWAIFLDKLIASIVMLSMGKAFTLFIAKYVLY